MTPAASTSPVPGPLRALGGVWRLTWPGFLTPVRLIVLGSTCALYLLLTVHALRAGQAAALESWAGAVHLAFLLPVLALLSGAGAVRDDMQPVAVDYALTRPVRRPLYLMFRYASQMACLQLTALAALAVLIAAGLHAGIDGLGPLAARIAAAQVLAIAGFCALGFLFGALSPRYLVLGVAWGMLVEVGIGRIPTRISSLSLTHHVHAMLEAPGVGPVGVVTLFAGLALAGAGAVFTWRQFTGAPAR